jgi:flagella basal body P-ring formation protein FlgA
MRHAVRYLAAWLGALAVPAALLAAEPADPVVVTLQPTAGVTGRQVRVGDVAAVTGGSAELRQFIAGLDLADAGSVSGTLTVSLAEVRFRIQIANIPENLVAVQGPAQVQVAVTRRVIEEDVVQTAREFLLRHLPWGPEDVTVELAQPVHVAFLPASQQDDLQLTPELRSSASLLGQVRVDVTVGVNGERHGHVPVYFQVKLFQQVAVCTQRIERGEAVTEERVRFDRRVADGPNALVTSKEALAGKRARHALLPGDAIRDIDLEAAPPEGPVIVRQHEPIRLITRVGQMQVCALGEALQDGRLAQPIRVLNTDSKKVVIGRVIGHGFVEVDY